MYEKMKGVWRIKRCVEDHFLTSPNFLYGEGKGEFFEDSKNTTVFHEKGMWNTGQKYNQSMGYFLEKDGLWMGQKGPAFKLDFTRTREVFHDIWEAHTCHTCGEDIYNLCMIWTGEHQFLQTFHISGPRKNYTLSVEGERNI